MDNRPVDEWNLFEKLRKMGCLDAKEQGRLQPFAQFRLAAALHGYIETEDASPTHGVMIRPWKGATRRKPADIVSLRLTSSPVMQIQVSQGDKTARLPDWKFDEKTIQEALRRRLTRSHG